MKRIILFVLLLTVAGIAGMMRTGAGRTVNLSNLPQLINGDSDSGPARDEIRKNLELAPGARVEVSGINGSVKIETSDTRSAEIYIERTGKCTEALNRRKVTIQNTANSLVIRGEKGDAGFFERMFGSSPTERVTLKLPRDISLLAKGINGAVLVGEVDGAVEVYGINGRVDIAQATGPAQFKGINGSVSVGLKQVQNDGVRISGINGNIELRLVAGVNAELDAHGMNGSVRSELSDVIIDKNDHGNRYSARIGTGGAPISISGINGNVRLTRAMTVPTANDQSK